MSFQNNCIWMPNGSGSLANAEMGHDTSTRIDQKRGPQWFIDASEQELFFNKKQAVECVNNSATSGAAIMNDSLWPGISSSQPGAQIGDRLFIPKPVRSSNVSDKITPSIVSADMNLEKKGYEDRVGNDSSICLSMSHSLEDPLCLNTGVRKVKVHEVRISENCLSEFGGNSCPGEKNKVIATPFQRTDNDMFYELAYNTADGNPFSMDPAFGKVEKPIISVGQASSKRDGNYMLGNQHYNWVDNSVLSTGQAFNSGNCNIITMGAQYQQENGNFMSVGPTYNKGHESFFVVDPFYNKANEAFMTSGSSYNKVDTAITSMTSYHDQQDATVVSLRTVYNKENFSLLPTSENYKNGEQTTISFGGFQSNPEESDSSGRLISSGDILLNQSSGALGHRDSVEQQSLNVISAATSRTDGAHKNKEQKKTKKASSNNFPANVKSLLSTGILDGVPVKYVSWSREKNLRGVVNGTAYLCDCKECKLSKAINAYEFERHAGCKTKHPNNHIYFENGKTIYGVVQELKSTPQEMLFDVIQNVTGSPVNQKNFQTWKASYQAATRELQRIYGKDDTISPC